MNIERMMLQILDDPTGVRIIVQTSYPDFSDESGIGNAYFMIDRGDCGCHIEGHEEEPKVFDYWQVTDSLGQCRKFNSNVELIEFVGSIESITAEMWVESF